MAESQASTALDECLFDDPWQLSQLLRQRAGSDRALHFTTSTESRRSGATASIAASSTAPPQFRAFAERQQQQSVAPASTAPRTLAAPRRVAPTPGNGKPVWSTHHSAPTSTGFVKDMDTALKRHRSFDGMDAPGDTQPDSQIYRHYTSGIHGSEETSMFSKMPSPKSLFTEHVDEEEGEGDSLTDGVELVESRQDQQSPNITSPTVIHDDDPMAALALSLYAPTSPLKFETPAVAARKTGNSAQMPSSAVRTNTTPGTVESAAAFPGFGVGSIAPMSLTQAWQNTQAPTSPAALPEPSEDMAFTRPSPNFTHARQSSPIPALSSPIKAMRDNTAQTDAVVRSSSEPRAEYVSMRESQERRKHTTGQHAPLLVEQDSWEKPSAAQLRNRKKKAKEHFERNNAMSFAFVSAPMPPFPQLTRQRPTNPSTFSPMKKQPVPGLGEHDSATIEFAHAMSTNELHDDSPDELSQDATLATQAPLKHNSKNNKVQVPKTSSHPTRTQSQQTPRNSSQLASPSSQLQRESQLQALASQPLLRESLRPCSSRDSVAIMDSQPDATANPTSMARPKALRFPSSPSTTQYSINQTTMATKTGWTSQVILSSIPPLPPGLSPEETMDAEDEEITPEGEEGVPSSPPITTNGDDVTYDEHERGYDEYGDENGVRDSMEPEIADEETSVEEEDDDLPIAKDEPEGEEDTNSKEEGVKEGNEIDVVEHEHADLSTDHEVPETLEHDNLQDARSEGQESSDEDEPSADLVNEKPPRVQRQDTVPETDALEETQPSFFPDESAACNDPPHAHDSAAPNQTNDTEPFHTAHEQLSGSQRIQASATNPREDGSGDIQMNEPIRSLQDIFNIPDTQQSLGEEEIEMPCLSGLTDDENLTATSSPARPSAKRQKVTYAAKHNVFRSPIKPANASEAEPKQSSPPLSEPQPTGEDNPTTASTQNRELKGANAVSQAREEAQAPYARQARLKRGPPPRTSRTKTRKIGALKSVNRKLLDSLSSPAVSPSKPKSHPGRRASTPVTPARGRRGAAAAAPDVDMPDADDQRDELADPSPALVQNMTAVEVIDESGDQPTGAIIAPNRVFASWPGSHFYPAICLGRVAGRQLQIRFDDGNSTSLEATQVRALDLRPGDHVKVNETGLKKHTYVVVGFKNKTEDVQGDSKPTTDQRGYTTVILEEKRRDSLPAAQVAQPVEHISVPMANIYLTTQLWTRLRDRSFNFSPPNSPSKSTPRIGTPLIVDPFATPSFSRRGTTLPSLLKGATARATSVASSSARSSSGVFSNMAFVLTSTAMDVDKVEIARTIKTNGGLVLEQGFHELFDHDANDAPTPSQSRRCSASVAEGTVGLTLKPAYKDLGFVALVSDSYSRSTKYIQALALNVPCLHLRWVQDSLNASRAMSFNRYLLPAGVSKFLDPNGVVRSRTMTAYDPTADDMSFAKTIGDRDLLLRGQTVLLVTGKSKKEIEKRQPFIFLTHALGSATVGCCADLAAAAELLRDAQWDWIYVDNGEAGVADAAAELFGTGKPAASGKQKKSKKRKRDEGEDELVARGEVAGKKVKITCAEFVIQSLILGALIEE